MTIYFVQSGAAGPIKIGVTNNLARRIATMATDNPEPLAILCTCDGDMSLEQRVHRALMGHCHRGEWFRPSPLVRDAIEAAKRGALSQWVSDREADRAARQLAELAEDALVVDAVRRWIKGMVDASSVSGVASRANLSPAKVRRFLRTGNGPLTDFIAIAMATEDGAITDILGKLGPQEMRA